MTSENETTQEEAPLLLDTIKSHLDSNDWNYHVAKRTPENTMIKAGAKGEVGNYQVVFDIKESRGIVLLYVIGPLNFPEECRQKIAVYTTLANYDVLVGNFELDMNDGEVRFKATIAGVDTDTLTDRMVGSIMGVSLVTMDRYYKGMIRIAYADMDSRAAYKEAKDAHEAASNPSQSIVGLLEMLRDSLVANQQEEETPMTEGGYTIIDDDDEEQPQDDGNDGNTENEDANDPARVDQ